ncbi:MAG: BadF/BadG/BcrA/BcrD ATPase family protein [Candidatus Coatesbacteria bacterium]
MTGLYLGVDGGGSKTAGVLAEASGQVLARVRLGGSAILAQMPPRSREALAGTVRSLCRQAGVRPGDITRAGVGLNGIDFGCEFPGQLRQVSAALGIPARRIILVNDAIPALWGATDEPAAALIQHGSGWTAAWRRRPGGERLFDHLAAGHPFDIRYEVLPLVSRMLDGRAERTALADRVLGYFRVPARRWPEAVFRGALPWSRQKLIPTLIWRAYLAGDRGALWLARRAAADYAAAACAMIRKTGSPRAFVGLGGGVINGAPERFRRLVARLVHERFPRAPVGRPARPPEIGAAVMAMSTGRPGVLRPRE